MVKGGNEDFLGCLKEEEVRKRDRDGVKGDRSGREVRVEGMGREGYEGCEKMVVKVPSLVQ